MPWFLSVILKTASQDIFSRPSLCFWKSGCNNKRVNQISCSPKTCVARLLLASILVNAFVCCFEKQLKILTFMCILHLFKHLFILSFRSVCFQCNWPFRMKPYITQNFTYVLASLNVPRFISSSVSPKLTLFLNQKFTFHDFILTYSLHGAESILRS